MPTKISYRDNEDRRKDKFLSYCVCSPLEALESLFAGYRIYRYGDIYLPLDSELDDMGNIVEEHGIIIQGATAPQGTQIIGTLESLDLIVTRSKLSYPRQDTEMREAFRMAIASSMRQFLDEFGTECSYLDAYDVMKREGLQERHYEQRIGQLLDVSKVAFGMREPTIMDLQDFLKG